MGSFNSLHTNYLTTLVYTSVQKRVNIAGLRRLSLKRHAYNTSPWLVSVNSTGKMSYIDTKLSQSGKNGLECLNKQCGLC